MKKNNKSTASKTDVGSVVTSILDLMKRKKITLADVCRAVNLMADECQKQTILQLRAEGNSIRKIARLVHIDDSRVSALIKQEHVCSKTTCKSCKTCMCHKAKK